MNGYVTRKQKHTGQPQECTCPPLVLGMASAAWAVPALTGFSAPSGNPCVLRARLGSKVLYTLSPSAGSFKGDAAELALQELSPRSAMRPLAAQGPLECRTPVTVPKDFSEHIAQASSVFPGDLIVRSPSSLGTTRELVLADLFDRFPAVVDALRRFVFELSRRDTTVALPWFGIRCAG